MTKEELVEFLIDNFTDGSGNLDLTGLDFSEFDGDIDISEMKVNGSLRQGYQQVEDDLFQDRQKVKGDLCQDYQKVEGDLWQGDQNVGGDLRQESQQVEGDLFEQNTWRLQGKEYKVDKTDGWILGIVNEFKKNGFTFKKLIDADSMEVYLVSNGNFSYHSYESFKRALKGLKEKIKLFNEDVKPKLDAIKSKGTITREDYQDLTGACEAGTNAFCERVGISQDVESITIEELKEKLKPTDYGYAKAKFLWEEEK